MRVVRFHPIAVIRHNPGSTEEPDRQAARFACAAPNRCKSMSDQAEHARQQAESEKRQEDKRPLLTEKSKPKQTPYMRTGEKPGANG